MCYEEYEEYIYSCQGVKLINNKKLVTCGFPSIFKTLSIQQTGKMLRTKKLIGLHLI